jgi:hypothetical protein
VAHRLSDMAMWRSQQVICLQTIKVTTVPTLVINIVAYAVLIISERCEYICYTYYFIKSFIEA